MGASGRQYGAKMVSRGTVAGTVAAEMFALRLESTHLVTPPPGALVTRSLRNHSSHESAHRSPEL